MSKNALVKSEISEVTSQEVTTLEVNVDDRRYTRLGWIIVIVGVLGFLLWASFAPLDKGVPIVGNVTVESSRKAVQHLTGGSVDQILVKDGDFVKAGQPLVKMNEVTTNANFEITNAQLTTALAVQARLIAERDNSQFKIPAELAAQENDPHVMDVVNVQKQLMGSRQFALKSELSAMEENISGLQFQLNGLKESMLEKKQQQKFIKEQLENMRELAKDGYVARNRLLDLERTFAQINAGITEDLATISRVGHQIAEVKLRKIQRQQDFQREVRTSLTDVQKEVELQKSRLVAQKFDLANSEVKAPVDGYVVGLSVFTKGAVVPGGFKLMEIVPKDDALVVEGVLPVNLIDKVHKDLPVELIFSAFNTNTTPHIPGVVTQVSADRAIDEKTGQPYYKVRAAVTPEGMKKLGELKVRPGMPVEIFVKTGERTMMNYLLKPITDRAHSALAED